MSYSNNNIPLTPFGKTTINCCNSISNYLYIIEKLQIQIFVIAGDSWYFRLASNLQKSMENQFVNHVNLFSWCSLLRVKLSILQLKSSCLYQIISLSDHINVPCLSSTYTSVGDLNIQPLSNKQSYSYNLLRTSCIN